MYAPRPCRLGDPEAAAVPAGRTRRLAAGCMAFITLGLSVPAVAQETPHPQVLSAPQPAYALAEDGWREWEGWTLRTGATFYAVDEDQGRFREDRFISNEVTGGIETLTYRDDTLNVTVRAILDDLYRAQVLYEQPEHFRLNLDFSRHRRYYDGSNEPWDSTRFLLPANLAERDDRNLYLDRVNLHLAGTLLMPGYPQATVGWKHAKRFGNDVLLRGGLARNDALAPAPTRRRSIPTVNDVDGVSDTLYVEVPFTIDDTYHVKLRQEYERYQANYLSITPTYNGGVFSEDWTQDDDLEWHEWRTLLGFDGFVTDGDFVSANYLYRHLENDSDRDVTRPGPAPSGGRTFEFVATDVHTDRSSHVATLGLALLNLAPHLTLHADLRAEHRDKDASHTGLQTPFFGALGPVQNVTSEEEDRLGESLRLVWRGLSRTTVTLDAEWEQRRLAVKEAEGGVFSRDADITYANQEYGVTVLHRPRRDLKLTGQYSFAEKLQDYDVNFDSDPAGYPDILGDLDQETHDASLKVDWLFHPAWTATAQYQYVTDTFRADIQPTDGQELDIHRVSGAVFGSPKPDLSVSGILTYESYELATPMNVPVGVNDFGPGTRLYDYVYAAYILSVGANYVLNADWTANGTYQHTEINGSDVNNGLDEVQVGLAYTIAEDKIVYARYEYFNFTDDLGSGFDDYDGHGFSVALAYRF